MEKTYLSISITYYNSTKVYIKPEVIYYRNDGVHPAIFTRNKMTTAEANLLMWELIRLGGKNSYSVNQYDNTICYRNVTYWGKL